MATSTEHEQSIAPLMRSDREPRSATAVTEADTELVVIEKRRFRSLVQETPYFAGGVMKVMVNPLRRQT